MKGIEDHVMTKVLLRSGPKIGHKGVEPILSELSCESSSYHHYGERRSDSRIDQVDAQVQDEHIEDTIRLKLAIYILIMDM
jgi:hypothetical protein